MYVRLLARTPRLSSRCARGHHVPEVVTCLPFRDLPPFRARLPPNAASGWDAPIRRIANKCTFLLK